MATSRHADVLPIFNRLTTLCLVASAIALIQLSLAVENDKSGYTWLYLLGFVQLLPFIISITRKHFDYLSFILLNHFVSFTYAKVNRYVFLEERAFLPGPVTLAARELLPCTILIIVSYYICRFLMFTSVNQRHGFQLLRLSRLQLLLVGGYVILIPFSIEWLPAQLLTIHFTLVSADILLLHCAHSPGNETLSRWISLLAPLACTVYFVRTGFLMFLGQFTAFFFIAACLQRRYERFIPTLLLIVFLSALQSVKEDYRTFLSQGGKEVGFFSKTGFLSELLRMKYFEDVPESEETESTDPKGTDGLLGGFDRVGDDSLERVLAMTPNPIPFWEGETYETIPYMFIPRALWSEKPSRHFWNKYGRTYGVLSPQDYQTSVGVGYLAEAYMNFGFMAMYLCSLFMGFFFALFERISYTFLDGNYYFAFLVFLIPLMSFGSDLGSMINSSVVLTIVLFTFRRIFAGMAKRDDYS